MIACCTLLALLLVSVAHGVHSDLGFNEVELPVRTFQDLDPDSGVEVTCEQCPPGQFLRQRCTASSRSVCEDCPPGSFTALWNYIGRCLRCGVCGRNMVQSSECSRNADCSCECRRGFYYSQRAGMCVRWAECGTGHGVQVKGTPQRDVECVVCANGTFSDQVSSESSCSAHSVCHAPRSEVVLKGSSWHDVICTSCKEARSHDAAHFLRWLLPSFFSHQGLSLRRLRHLVSRLPSADGMPTRHRGLSGLNQDQLKSRLDQWVSESSAEQLRTLPQILNKTGALSASERLAQKLQRIEAGLQQICPTATGPGLNQL